MEGMDKEMRENMGREEDMAFGDGFYVLVSGMHRSSIAMSLRVRG